MGRVLKPSPSEGEVKPMTKKLTPDTSNVGPMVCGHSANSIQHPGFHPNPAVAQYYHQLAGIGVTQCPTSKSQMVSGVISQREKESR